MEFDVHARSCGIAQFAARTPARIVCIAVWLVAVSTSHAQIQSFPQAARLETAYTLGSGGFTVSGGYVPIDDRRMPRSGRPSIRDAVNVGGVAFDRNVSYVADGGLAPISLGFSIGGATDLYLSGTLFSGTSEKTVENFFGVSDQVLLQLSDDERAQFDRVYEQPIFDFGFGVKHQIMRELGDGMPAVAFGVTGRFGFSGDDFGGFNDSTPEDGFADFGVGSYLAVSRSFGELLALHGMIGLSASKKLDSKPKTSIGVALEWSLVPETLVLVGDYTTRRDVAGFEYPETVDRITFGVRYRLASGTSVQVLSAPGGHLLFSFARLGDRVEAIAPPLPQVDDLTF